MNEKEINSMGEREIVNKKEISSGVKIVNGREMNSIG